MKCIFLVIVFVLFANLSGGQVYQLRIEEDVPEYKLVLDEVITYEYTQIPHLSFFVFNDKNQFIRKSSYKIKRIKSNQNHVLDAKEILELQKIFPKSSIYFKLKKRGVLILSVNNKFYQLKQLSEGDLSVNASAFERDLIAQNHILVKNSGNFFISELYQKSTVEHILISYEYNNDTLFTVRRRIEENENSSREYKTYRISEEISLAKYNYPLEGILHIKDDLSKVLIWKNGEMFFLKHLELIEIEIVKLPETK